MKGQRTRGGLSSDSNRWNKILDALGGGVRSHILAKHSRRPPVRRRPFVVGGHVGRRGGGLLRVGAGRVPGGLRSAGDRLAAGHPGVVCGRGSRADDRRGGACGRGTRAAGHEGGSRGVARAPPLSDAAAARGTDAVVAAEAVGGAFAQAALRRSRRGAAAAAGPKRKTCFPK